MLMDIKNRSARLPDKLVVNVTVLAQKSFIFKNIQEPPGGGMPWVDDGHLP